MKLILFLILIFHTLNSNAQLTIKIDVFGKIICPASMELQGGIYKEYVDKVKEINGVSASKVVLQQKGLNEGSGEFDTYARVMIRTSFGDFSPITLPVTQSEADEVNDSFENQIKSEAYSNNAVILNWSKAVPTTLNGYKAIRFGYKRIIGSNPVVSVETYLIQNTSKMYSITFENRTDSYNWASVFAKIKSTIKINNN